ncbi:hypothetical protein A2363_03755 [Candidatus Gottesmanbacteria bacterium RIFOXYB1_FULL_47_11]|uniref:Type 4 fimbrial biogenesis protein PilX N-terminal domain-containing protein n=1 Tax=Candidatus Gottesmanbacteria bacterium RIFOXYB1_FULL_47_11 TaxID=1798401 RepID=A0A1F6BED2_9BACT|nr:MAG: hypothetical protein A2363_03755 [Candidatus Gottesmanbacteria bacterium RIFOXYB1_FULL_47_11]
MQRGQTALIALLVLTIATTVGLSLVARSTTDISMTRTLEESARAFSAAEAGVEVALKTGAAITTASDSELGTTYTAMVSAIRGTETSPLVFPSKTPAGDTTTVWLADHDANDAIDDAFPPKYPSLSSVSVCWSKESDLEIPAIVVTILYKESTDVSGNPYRVAKAAYDPDGARANNFSDPGAFSGGCGDGKTTYRQEITFASFTPAIDPAADVLIALRIRPVYYPAQLAVQPVGQQLPVQWNQITSVGQTASGVNRKIVVNQAYKSPSSVFDAAIYSQQDFSHLN